jgi:hypothetical protein
MVIQQPQRLPAHPRILFGGKWNSGKTKTMLGTAQIYSGDQPFLVIDLEVHDGVNPASTLYADLFPNFRALISVPRATPDQFIKALEEAYQYAAPVLVIDGLAELWYAAEEWNLEVAKRTNADKPDKHGAYRITRPVLNRAVKMMLDYPGCLLASCLVKDKTKREAKKKPAQADQMSSEKQEGSSIESFEGYQFKGIEDRFASVGLALMMTTDPKDKRIKYLRTHDTKIEVFKALDFKNPGKRFAQMIYEWYRQEPLPEISLPPQPTPPAAEPISSSGIDDEDGALSTGVSSDIRNEVLRDAILEEAAALLPFASVEEMMKRRDWSVFSAPLADAEKFRTVLAHFIQMMEPLDGYLIEDFDQDFAMWYYERGWAHLEKLQPARLWESEELWSFNKPRWVKLFKSKKNFEQFLRDTSEDDLPVFATLEEIAQKIDQMMTPEDLPE